MPYLITPAGCRCCHLQVYVTALEVKQPADDNCIYHSLSEGAKRGGVNFGTPGLLREACTDFFVKNSLCRLGGLGGHALREVASHHERTGVETYAKAMRSGKWGGALEIAVSEMPCQATDGQCGPGCRVGDFDAHRPTPVG